MKQKFDNLVHGTHPREVNRLPIEYRYITSANTNEFGTQRQTSDSKVSYKSILVPLDGTPFSEHALPMALQIAKRTGARIHLVHMHTRMRSIYDSDRIRRASAIDEYIKLEHISYLFNLARRLERTSSVHVKPHLIEANDVGESLSYVGNVGADLVVMATHGYGRLGNWLCDSMANKLSNRAMVPHLFVKGRSGPVDLTKRPSLRHILIPLDGSKAAECALRPADALADATNSNRTLLRVLKNVSASAARRVKHETQGTLPDSDLATASVYLDTIAKSLGGYEPAVRTHIVREEKSIAASILAESKRHDADVIALTSRARSSLDRLFRPSMVERLLHKGSVPVLMCPQVD